jgi:hypothetical protein
VSREQESLVAEPYTNRQLIVVSQDATAEAAKEESWKEVQGANRTWTQFARTVVKNTFQSAKSDPLRTYVLSVPVELGIQGVKAWRKDRQDGAPVRKISSQQAGGMLFPPGHPRPGVVYVGHPFIPTVYFPMADFHRMMLEHKWNEAVHLLASLGATSIRAEHVSGASRDFAAKAFASAASSGATASVDASAASKSGTSFVFNGDYAGAKKAKLPENLGWFPHEPTWQMVARGRIEFGMTRFSMEVSYLDDFGVNVDAQVKLTKAGFGFGGKFEGHESSVWKLEGEFRPLA